MEKVLTNKKNGLVMLLILILALILSLCTKKINNVIINKVIK